MPRASVVSQGSRAAADEGPADAGREPTAAADARLEALIAARFDALMEAGARRALDGLDGDTILAIGHEQLGAMHEARREAGRAIDPSLTESEVVDRVKA